MGRTKLQRIFSTVAILGVFLVVGIFILMSMGTLTASRGVVDLLLIVGIICFGCISCMIVARYINDKSKRIPVLIVLVSTGVTCLLWIIFVFVGQSFIDAINSGNFSEGSVKALLVFAKIIVFITIQTSFANLLVSNLFKLRNDMMIFQIIMYVSNAIMDFWLCALILSLTITGDGLEIGWKSLYESKFWVTLFVLSTVYTFVSNIILRKYERHKVTEDVVYGKETSSDEFKKATMEKKEEASRKEVSVEDRIKKLDDLKEKGLINDEEYANRKSKILEDI